MIKLLRKARRGGLWRIGGGTIVMGIVLEILVMWTVLHAAPENFWFIFVPISGVLSLFALGLFVTGWKVLRRPLEHARFAGIRGTDAEMHGTLLRLERDLPGAEVFSLLSFGNVQLTAECVVTNRLILSLHHVVWVSPQRTQRSIDHIPLGTTKDLAIYTTPEGAHYDAPLVLMPDDAAALMSAIAKRAPWAFVGSQPRWENRWEEMRGEIARQASERRAKLPA